MENGKQSNVINLMSFVADRTMALARENTVVGEKIEVGGMTIIPISKLSVSFAGGGADLVDAKKSRKQTPAGGGAKVDLVPVSCLVIKDGSVDVANIKLPDNTAGAELVTAIVEGVKDYLDKKTEDRLPPSV